MADIIKETTKTEETAPNSTATTSSVETRVGTSDTLSYLIYFIFGVLEVLLVFRLILKITGANPVSSFVSLIYSVTQIFILPFEGIFRSGFAQGVETTSVLEPATLVAIVVYAVLSWGITKLFAILTGKPKSAT